VFSIKQVRVEGVQTLKVEDMQSLSGINPGTNTFKLNLKEIQDRIALNPMVKQVQVTRQYPSAVLVQIEERKAVALLSWKGEYIAVDAEGYYITEVKDFSKANLPIITGIRLGNLTLGKLIPGEGLAACLSFIQKMDQNLLANISELNGTDSLGIVLFTIEGTEVRLGASERVEKKLALLREVLKNSYGRKVEYIDITFSGKPVIKFKDTL
jgi:cell division protein FtsQ